ncbi:flavin reductase family protein [Streptomyces sp. 150FB]|uniref:flavin reductase family protein n=1 Tax=Streptomyces sp. 150FB TaxID=1576605 RepID=UPI00069866A2|nr:flavin reductase family protein [Streptomyces sp. 150FB]
MDFADLLDHQMYVVTAASGGTRAGCLVGFASQCSISPERFMVWLSKENHTYRVALEAPFLGVHLLAPEQFGLAELFGSRTGDLVDKFAEVPWRPGPGGTPVLTDVPAWFVGRVERHTDGGDHVGFVLSPADGGARDVERGATLRLSDVLGLTPGHPAG